MSLSTEDTIHNTSMDAAHEVTGLNDSKDGLTLQRQRSDSQLSDARLQGDDDTDDEIGSRPRRGHARPHMFRA